MKTMGLPKARSRRCTAFLLALLLLAACVPAAEEPSAEDGCGLWFAVGWDSGRDDSSVISREEREWDGEPDALELMKALLAGPETDALRSPFPPGVVVRAIAIDPETGTAQVDLSEQYGGLAGFDLTVADYCIALTLCQLPEVKTVEVLVEGEPIPYRERQALRTGDVLLSGISEEPDVFLAALFFPDQDGGALIPEYRQVTRPNGGRASEIAMAELLRGPADTQACLPLPEGTHVRALTVANGVCQVDLSGEFLSSAPADEEQAGLVLYALVNTLCALGELNQVQILVEGERVEFYGGVSTGAPLSANLDLVRGD